MTFSFVRFILLGIFTTTLLSSSVSWAMKTHPSFDNDSSKSTKRMRRSDGGSVTTDRDQTRHNLKHKKTSSEMEVESIEGENQKTLETFAMLPHEMRHYEIFPFLATKDLLSLRSACTQLKREIEEYVVHRRPLVASISFERLNAWCRQEINNPAPIVYRYFKPNDDAAEIAMCQRMSLGKKQYILNDVYQVPNNCARVMKKLYRVSRKGMLVSHITAHINDIDSCAFGQIIFMAKLAKTKAITISDDTEHTDYSADKYLSVSIFHSLRECPDLEIFIIPSDVDIRYERMQESLDALCEVLPHTNLRVLGICGWTGEIRDQQFERSYENMKKLFIAVKNSQIEYLDISDVFCVNNQVLAQIFPFIMDSGLKRLYWGDLGHYVRGNSLEGSFSSRGLRFIWGECASDNLQDIRAELDNSRRSTPMDLQSGDER